MSTQIKCPKCGSKDVDIIEKFMENSEHFYGEVLHLKCRRCEYEWYYV